MPLAAGARLGPYEILAPIGAGGMGEVYRARDTRLDRIVAVKVLPAELAADPQFRERFEREARLISSLSHPHVCPLFDVGNQDGVEFLVMEHLEGETLAARLEKGPVPLDQALAIAIETAAGLDAAHRAGVVHRDLKPGNVMLTKSGAKLLDFGLAKSDAGRAAVRTSGISAATFTPTALPTSPPVKAITAQGTILGTFQYMAPEQLEGLEADTRTDIFAFGALLYEMVTGRRAFAGKSHVSLLAAIVDHDPPPVSSVTPVSPPLLDHLVKTCLAKNPDKRWQTMADVLIQLQLIVDSGGQLGSPAAARTVGRRLRIAWSVAAALGVLCAVSAALALVSMFSGTSADRPRINFEIPTPSAPSPLQIAVSPSGSHVVSIVNSDRGNVLWVRALGQLDGQTLRGTEFQNGGFPFWSPDGRFIAFFSDGLLKKVDLHGAPPQTLCDAPTPRGGTWNREDVIVFAPATNGPLFRVSATGGAAAQLTELDQSRQEVAHFHPTFLPDGRHFLYVAISRKAENSGIVVGSLDSKDRKFVITTGVRATFARPDRLLFMRDSTLMAQRFDPKRLELGGDPYPIAENVGVNSGNSAAGFSVSENGTLAYRPGGATTNNYLKWFDRSGKDSAVVEASGAYRNPALSPDLQHIAAGRRDSLGTGDIWVLDLARGTSTRFTVDPGDDDNPLWSPDGSRLVFRSSRAGTFDLYVKSSSGVAQEEVLLKSDHAKSATDWSADGRFLLYADADPQTGNDIWMLPMTGERKPQPVVRSQFSEYQGKLAPDGRWIAYVSTESGRSEIYAQGFPKAASRTQISTAGGDRPHWRGDGKELFFMSPVGEMMAVDVGVAADGGLRAGRPTKLFAVNPLGWWDVTPDGQRFLINTYGPQSSGVVTPITVVVNWDRPGATAKP